MGNASQCTVKYDEIFHLMAHFINVVVIALLMAQYLCEAMVTFSAQLDYNVIDPLHTLLKGLIIHILLFYNGRCERIWMCNELIYIKYQVAWNTEYIFQTHDHVRMIWKYFSS